MINEIKTLDLSNKIINDNKSKEELLIDNIQNDIKNILSKYVNFNLSDNLKQQIMHELTTNLQQYEHDIYYDNQHNSFNIKFKTHPYKLTTYHLNVTLK